MQSKSELRAASYAFDTMSYGERLAYLVDLQRQHRIELLKARIDELGRNPFVRIRKDTFFGPEWASNRYDKLKAELDKLQACREPK